jgi:prepilin-type processing-associated H-X9-DG protein
MDFSRKIPSSRRPIMNSRKNTHSSSRTGFTLTEVLVVVLILIVLAVLGLSGVTKLRGAADKAASVRNLAQIQLANTSYATDHGGRFVPIFIFDEHGSQYVGWTSNSEFLIHLTGDTVSTSSGKVSTALPLNLMDPIVVRAKKRMYQDLSASYGYNTTGVPGGTFGQPNASPAFTLSQLRAPDRTAAFITATDWNVRYVSRFKWEGAAAVEGKTSDQKTAYRHRGAALVAYYDGHVGEVTVADVKRFDTLGGTNHLFWNGAPR